MEVAPYYKLLEHCLHCLHNFLITLFTLFTVPTLLVILLKLRHTVTVACVPKYRGKVRTLLEWADALLSKMLDWSGC